MFWVLISLWYFGGSIVWEAFLFAGEWLMSPKFQRIHLTPQWSVANYRLISLTPIVSVVFGHLVSVRFGRFMECRGVFPTTQFGYREGLDTCDAPLCVAYTLQSALETGREARIDQIDFSFALTGSTIRGSSVSSALWELEVLCSLF